ncbi:MAG TPA: hypothetical protein VJN62_02325 [Gemmatimonadales bacterium]|nr:hypothetical protein [Gemmatimonadales bacterium]
MPSDALAILDAIPAEHIPAAVMRLSARLMTPAAATQADDLLSVAEAATLLRQSKRWMYAHADALGGLRLSPRKMVFPRRTVLTRLARKARRS